MDKRVYDLAKQIGNHETNHLMHLIFTFMTGGIWLLVWGCCAVGNAEVRKDLEKEIKEIEAETKFEQRFTRGDYA